MENLNNSKNDELEKLIMLKKLEIEKLKLEQSNHGINSAKYLSYKNVIGINILILFIILGAFFLPWGNLNTSASLQLSGSSSNITSNYSGNGFEIGLLSFTWPFLALWAITFIFAILNQVKVVGVIAIFGIFMSIWILAVLSNMGISVSLNGIGTVDTGFDTFPLVYIPILGFSCLLFNFFVGKSLINRGAGIEDIGKFNKIELQSERKATEERMIKESVEKNKSHFCNKSKLNSVLKTEFALVIGMTLLARFFHYEVMFFISLFLIVVIAVEKGMFSEYMLIKSFFIGLLTKTILISLFFFIQIYWLFEVSYVYEIIEYKGMYVELLQFILTGTLLYLNFVALSCIKLNHNEAKYKYFKLSVMVITVTVSLFILYSNKFEGFKGHISDSNNNKVVLHDSSLEESNLVENQVLYLYSDLVECNNIKDLIKLYGENSVVDRGIAMTEEEQEIQDSNHVLLFSNTNNEVDIIYSGGTAHFTFEKSNSNWKLPLNIHPGISLSELENINGAPILFYGFEWDYSGLINSWSDGKLSKLEGLSLSGAIGGNLEKIPTDIYSQLIGDGLLNSNMPLIKNVDMELINVVLIKNK